MELFSLFDFFSFLLLYPADEKTVNWKKNIIKEKLFLFLNKEWIVKSTYQSHTIAN